jgi:hypothetical protein
MKPIANVAVAQAFEVYPSKMRRKLLVLRQLILDIAAATDGVGEIEETLKWGEPAYLTKNKGGSTVSGQPYHLASSGVSRPLHLLGMDNGSYLGTHFHGPSLSPLLDQ